jgi:hypothetical protein
MEFLLRRGGNWLGPDIRVRHLPALALALEHGDSPDRHDVSGAIAPRQKASDPGLCPHMRSSDALQHMEIISQCAKKYGVVSTRICNSVRRGMLDPSSHCGCNSTYVPIIIYFQHNPRHVCPVGRAPSFHGSPVGYLPAFRANFAHVHCEWIECTLHLQTLGRRVPVPRRSICRCDRVYIMKPWTAEGKPRSRTFVPGIALKIAGLADVDSTKRRESPRN